MLSAVRRAPGSLARVLSSTSPASSLAGRVGPRTCIPTPFRHQTAFAARQLHSTPRWQRFGSAAARIVENASAEAEDQNNEPSSLTAHDTKKGHITTFQELVERHLVEPNLIRPITDDMRITTMTRVQSLTINHCLKGTDV